jgi:hypothetical protein
MFDVAEHERLLTAGWVILCSVDHAIFRQIYIGFPNGYALSMVQGIGSSSSREDGTVEIAYAVWNGVDKDSREVVSYGWATEQLKLSDNIQGWVPVSTGVSTALWLAGLPDADFTAATAEPEYEEEPYDDEPEYDEYPEEHGHDYSDPWFDNAW